MRSPILEDLDIAEAAKALWEAPFAVLSHDKFESEDPKFTYANKVRPPWPVHKAYRYCLKRLSVQKH